MSTTICRRYDFEAAHHLQGVVAPTHKCHRIHGHSYVLEVMLAGELENGMVRGLEFDVIDAVVKAITTYADHQLLNDLPGLEVPTIENIAPWFANGIKRGLHLPDGAVTVRIHEGPRSWAEVTV
jgi:6-pyruvoyltetrahydropterin/6-carboxytetrahydropterin synthase